MFRRASWALHQGMTLFFRCFYFQVWSNKTYQELPTRLLLLFGDEISPWVKTLLAGADIDLVCLFLALLFDSETSASSSASASQPASSRSRFIIAPWRSNFRSRYATFSSCSWRLVSSWYTLLFSCSASSVAKEPQSEILRVSGEAVPHVKENVPLELGLWEMERGIDGVLDGERLVSMRSGSIGIESDACCMQAFWEIFLPQEVAWGTWTSYMCFSWHVNLFAIVQLYTRITTYFIHICNFLSN